MLIAQFTYTACQQPGPYDSVPGWKVKQVEPQGVSRELIQDAARSFGSFKSPSIDALATMSDVVLNSNAYARIFSAFSQRSLLTKGGS